VSVNASVSLAGQDLLLVSAIVLVGIVSARAISELLLIPSAIIALAVIRSAKRTSKTSSLVIEAPQSRNLPRDLDRTVGAAMSQLGDSEARMLLVAIVQQADMLFAPRESPFDAAKDSITNGHVSGLVSAACATALELANLDASRATVAGSMATPTSAQLELTSRLQNARALMARRLSDAADALQALYAAGVERGTPASDRVAELAAELRGDASARGEALAEINALLESKRRLT
jgi:hypothetical protein